MDVEWMVVVGWYVAWVALKVRVETVNSTRDHHPLLLPISYRTNINLQTPFDVCSGGRWWWCCVVKYISPIVMPQITIRLGLFGR